MGELSGVRGGYFTLGLGLMVLIQQMVYLFNLSLRSGIFPKAWKLATMVPLFKGGSKFEKGNYRSISLLLIPGKMLENIVHCSLTGHLEDNNLLTEHQNGFRKGYSTTSSVATLTEDIFRNMNCKMVTVAVFVDLAKAFNTVNHYILLAKLVKLGVTGMLLNWCKNYLQDRAQRTIANNVLSPINMVPCGVPQGSILGPLFFLIYINDLTYSLKSTSIQLYADDTVLYCSDSDENNIVSRFRQILTFSLTGVWQISLQ